MTQGGNDPLTPLHRLSTASLNGVVRAFAYHRYFRFFLSLFFSTPLNEFFDDFDDLLPKVLAAQQPKECFRHALDPIQHIFLEPNFSCALPFGKSLQSCIPSVPPVE